MANNEPVILSEEPSSIRINIQDPNKPKNVGGKMIKKEKKKTFLDKLIAAFCGADINRENLPDYILKEKLEPFGLRMINNGVQTGLRKAGDATQVMLFGRVVNSSNGPVDYSSYSLPSVAKPGGFRVMDQVDVFAFTDRRRAEECLAYLRGRIQTYGSASVVDYYEWINTHLEGVEIPLDYNMTYRGWMDLNNVSITPDPNGFIINFPRPVGLKRG